MKPALSCADMADAVFVAAQYEAERIAVLRDLVNREGERGLSHRMLAEATDRGHQLVAAFNLLYDLVPAEADFFAAIEEARSERARRSPPARPEGTGTGNRLRARRAA